MEVFDNIIGRLEAVLKGMPVKRVDVLKQPLIKAQIIDLNTSQLEDKGVYNDNTPVQPPYAELTLKIKSVKGQRTDHVTLKDEGDFYSGWDINYGTSFFILLSKDSKTAALVKKYGGQIFGLTPDNLTEVRIMALPYYIAAARELGNF